MAMIKCPECGRDISDRAEKCPQCGYPIQEKTQGTDEESTVNENKSDTNIENEKPGEVTIPSDCNPKKKKIAIIGAAACVAFAAIIGIALGSNALTSKVKVDDISINKWRLTDSTKYSDYYEGTVTSDQKKPFIAVIGQYDDADAVPSFVYVEDGKGVFETYEDTDEDPSAKYRPLGYLGGKAVSESDVKVSCSDDDYSDWEYSQKSSCIVTIDIDMNNKNSGFLIIDVENETNNETSTNLMVNIIDGKGTYSYYASLPYKSRGVDVSVVPKATPHNMVIR